MPLQALEQVYMRPNVNSNRLLKSQTALKNYSTYMAISLLELCCTLANHSKILLHMRKWYLLINASFIIDLVINFNDSAQRYYITGIYCLHGKLTALWNFTSVKLTEAKFASK